MMFLVRKQVFGRGMNIIEFERLTPNFILLPSGEHIDRTSGDYIAIFSDRAKAEAAIAAAEEAYDRKIELAAQAYEEASARFKALLDGKVASIRNKGDIG